MTHTALRVLTGQSIHKSVTFATSYFFKANQWNCFGNNHNKIYIYYNTSKEQCTLIQLKPLKPTFIYYYVQDTHQTNITGSTVDRVRNLYLLNDPSRSFLWSGSSSLRCRRAVLEMNRRAFTLNFNVRLSKRTSAHPFDSTSITRPP